MKLTNAEAITGQNGGENLRDIVQNAEMKVGQIEMEALEAQEEVRSLELELLEAQAAHEAQEATEQKGKETGEKIGELTG